MIESIVLDILLVLIVLLLMAIGAYRGGLREAFSAGGLLLGVLLANEWLDTWGGWFARNTNLSDGGARFLVAVTVMTAVTIAVGYGVGSTFNYHPGPGGRLFGMVLGFGIALVAMSYVITWLRLYLFDGDGPDVVTSTFLARFLDGDAGVVLLLVSIATLGSALIGSIVRERDDAGSEVGQARSMPVPTPRRHLRDQRPDFPEKVEPITNRPTDRTAPIRVREAQQWQDRSGGMPLGKDRLWSNTWPSDSPGVKPETSNRPAGDVRQARERRQREGDGSSDRTSEV